MRPLSVAITRAVAPALALMWFTAPLGLAAQESETTSIAEDESPSSEQGVFGSTDTQTILPSELTSDQIIQFFTQFSAQKRIEDAFAPVLELMMTPGEPVEGWSEGGIDILAEVEAMDGGAEGNMLRDINTEILLAFDISGAVSPDLSGFKSYALRPEPIGLVEERGFASFNPGLWFETAHQRRRLGNALCYSGYAGITLHTRRPHTDWTEDELLTTAAIFALVDRTADREFCVVYDRGENGTYTSKAFLPDGRELPTLNEEMTPSEVMPTNELAEFLKREPSGLDVEAPEQ